MSTAPITLVYSKVDGIDIKVDVYPPKVSGNVPALIFFHGGGLCCGSRNDPLTPLWMRDAAHERGWAYMSADYRLLVPSTSHDQLADIRALSLFISSGAISAGLPSSLSIDPSAILVAGASAGGYMAVQYALHATPKPKGVLDLFGMVDLLNNHWLTKFQTGVRFFGGYRESYPTIDRFIGQNASPQPCSEAPLQLPALTCEDGRNLLVTHALQEGTMLDFMTGQRGLSASLAELATVDARADAIEEKDRILFPLLRAGELPPVFIIHGDEDSAVPVSDSQALAKLLEKAAIRHELIVLNGAEHGLFSLEDQQPVPGTEEAYKKGFEFLETCM